MQAGSICRCVQMVRSVTYMGNWATIDTFFFKTGWDADTITDFNAEGRVHNVLDVSGVKSIRNWKDLRQNHLEVDGDDIVIDAGNGNLIRLEGGSRGDVDKGDFLF